MADTSSSPFNENQRRHLRATCEHIDRLLDSLQEALAASPSMGASPSPPEADRAAPSRRAFPRFVADLAPATARALDDEIGRLRGQLLRIVEAQGIPALAAAIPASRSAAATLLFIELALDELAPRNVRGYGEVSPAAAEALRGIVDEIHQEVSRMRTILAAGAGTSRRD